MRYVAIVVLLGACSVTPERRVERAVDAAGGRETLESVESWHIGSAGTYLGSPYTSTSHFRRPDEWRWDLESEGMDMKVWILADDAYMATGGQKAVEIRGAEQDNWRLHFWVAACTNLPDVLLEPDVELARAEPLRLGEEELPAITARHPELGPVTIGFDPETDRIRAVSFESVDPESGGPVPTLLEIQVWEHIDGVETPTQMRMTMDMRGQEWIIDERVLDVRWNPAIEEGVLAAPETREIDYGLRIEPETLVAVHTFVGPYHEVGNGIGRVMAWIGEHGGRPAGPVALVYREPPNPDDYDKSETIIHVPVEGMDDAPRSGDVRVARRPPFRFAFARYEGPAAGCHMLFGNTLAWAEEGGLEKVGPFRVHYLSMDQETGICTAEVGCAVRRKE